MLEPMNLIILILILILCIASQYMILERWIRHKEREWALLLKIDSNKALAPLKISAYERLIVMLERISPGPLVMRQRVSGTSAALLQLELIKAIREEFEHNVSLQMYVHEDCWNRIRAARDETTELIKIAFTRVRPESPGMELSNEIFKLEAATGNSAIRDAIAAVRDEMARYF
jgi:hypothetical protein